jgi:hypothetical protein
VQHTLAALESVVWQAIALEESAHLATDVSTAKEIEMSAFDQQPSARGGPV